MQTKIALGTWSWGTGMAGGDQVFGNHTDEAMLRPVFEAAMKSGLTLWDTATVYGMGESERILGHVLHPRRPADGAPCQRRIHKER
ncbi:MAG: aldo/keto reductase [Bacteroidaceae bacterium]|nr:aldo/keto reductase [Bacteroidaceae bacterium]